MPHVHIADTFNMEVVVTTPGADGEERVWHSAYLPDHPTVAELSQAVFVCPFWDEEPSETPPVIALRVVHAGETLALVDIDPSLEERTLWRLADALWHVAAELIRARYDGCLDVAEEKHQLFLRHGLAVATPPVAREEPPF